MGVSAGPRVGALAGAVALLRDDPTRSSETGTTARDNGAAQTCKGSRPCAMPPRVCVRTTPANHKSISALDLLCLPAPFAHAHAKRSQATRRDLQPQMVPQATPVSKGNITSLGFQWGAVVLPQHQLLGSAIEVAGSSPSSRRKKPHTVLGTRRVGARARETPPHLTLRVTCAI
jgi:hypothetical protein